MRYSESNAQEINIEIHVIAKWRETGSLLIN